MPMGDETSRGFAHADEGYQTTLAAGGLTDIVRYHSNLVAAQPA